MAFRSARGAKHPPSPEVWAFAMLGVIGAGAVGFVVFYFLGALSGKQLLALIGLAALGVVSVILRYLGNARLPNS
jgi:high-affinity Fe2+/Pb2+ permease